MLQAIIRKMTEQLGFQYLQLFEEYFLFRIDCQLANLPIAINKGIGQYAYREQCYNEGN